MLASTAAASGDIGSERRGANISVRGGVLDSLTGAVADGSASTFAAAWASALDAFVDVALADASPLTSAGASLAATSPVATASLAGTTPTDPSRAPASSAAGRESASAGAGAFASAIASTPSTCASAGAPLRSSASSAWARRGIVVDRAAPFAGPSLTTSFAGAALAWLAAGPSLTT